MHQSIRFVPVFMAGCLITVDKNPAYPRAVADMKQAGQLWRFTRLRQCKYLNDIVEQDHRQIKRLVRPGLGFASLRRARLTLAGYEAMAMIRKEQAHNIGGRDIRAQAAFVAEFFQVAVWKLGVWSQRVVVLF